MSVKKSKPRSRREITWKPGTVVIIYSHSSKFHGCKGVVDSVNKINRAVWYTIDFFDVFPPRPAMAFMASELRLASTEKRKRNNGEGAEK